MAKKKRRSDGTGSIFKDAEGRWTGQIGVGFTASGRTRYMKKRAKTEAEIVQWLREMTAREMGGQSVAPDKLTVEDYLDGWFSGVERSARFATYTSYHSVYRIHVKPAIGKLRMSRLNTANVQSVLNAAHDAQKALKTIRNIRAMLRKAFGDCKRQFPNAYDAVLASKLPASDKREKRATPIIQAFSPEEARLFLAAVEQHRLKALYWLALLLGLRQGELLGLRLIDIDMEARTVRVAGQNQSQTKRGIVRVPTKTDKSSGEAKAPLLPMPAILVPVLREHLAMLEDERLYAGWKERGLLFPSERGTPMHASNLWRGFKAILKANDLPNIRFHDLRHSCATLLISLGTHPRVVMEILRHTQISTTMNLYGHVIPEQNRDALDGLGALVQPETLEMPRKKKVSE